MTLAQVAEREGVSTGAVIDAMVAAAKAHLAEEVAEGDLTQVEADAKATQLETRIAESVDEPLRSGRGHHGSHRRHGGGSGDAAEGEDATPRPVRIGAERRRLIRNASPARPPCTRCTCCASCARCAAGPSASSSPTR